MAEKPVVICILDGWGIREAAPDNAVAAAHTPFLDHLFASYPNSAIRTDGAAVGLPEGQMGNSEVGHMNIGAGRIVMQTLPRIDAAIADGTFTHLPALQEALTFLQNTGGRAHVAGLCSPGGVHSHQNHIIAAARFFAEHGVKVMLHLFTDGRDVPPRSAKPYIAAVKEALADVQERIVFASIAGRYYAMDRDNRAERTGAAYNAMITAQSERCFSDPQAYIESCYAEDISDEFFPPATGEGAVAADAEKDVLFFANFRADRMRQLAGACFSRDFGLFPRPALFTGAQAVMMSEYDPVTAAAGKVLFPPDSYPNIFGELLEKAGKKQLRIAETEKYAHVTFFFNGGRDAPFANEDRALIPSPDVATYDLKPDMSAPEVTDRLISEIEKGEYAAIILNYANTDMVGHTGVFEAAKKAIEAVDGCLARLTPAVLKAGGKMLITADHGNAEMMRDPDTGEPHTAHTMTPVPLIYVAEDAKNKILTNGRLCDIAPTALACLGMEQPAEMTGVNLLRSA